VDVRLVLQEGFDPMRGKSAATIEELQFDAEERADDFCTEVLQELNTSFNGSSGCKKIIYNPHLRSGL
jgi:hypothetical protein